MGPDPTFIGFLVATLGTVGAFLAWLIKDTLSDTRKQRDTATIGWQGQTEANNKLADALHERNTIDQKMLDLIKDGGGK